MLGQTNRMANPMFRALSREEAATTGETATYSGIFVKTLYFLVTTLIGVFVYFITNRLFSTAGGAGFAADGYSIYAGELYLLIGAALLAIVTPILTHFMRRLIAVLGTIYALSQGYLIAFVSNAYGHEYKGIIYLALGLTLLLIVSLLAIYSTGKIKIGGKFRAALGAALATVVIGSILLFLSSLLFPHNAVVNLFYGNGVFSIVYAAAGVVLAALFLLSDFEVIRRTVEDKLPQSDEWYAAFGLVITVLWLYLKILSLVARIMGRAKN